MSRETHQKRIKTRAAIHFSVMVDGSNDAGLDSMFPISINIFDLSFNWIRTKFFDMNMLETGDICIGLDNTNPNIGEHNSIKSRTIEKIQKLLFHVALTIFYIMHSASLLMSLMMVLILALEIIVLTFFTGLRSDLNGNLFEKNTISSVIKAIKR